jgi:glycosyltransferase involved in cell wall biosynthesis
MNKLGLIVPCYNEEAVISYALEQLDLLFKNLINEDKIATDSFMVFIDDGSHDSTWSIISDKKLTHEHVAGIRFSRNFGHQNALLAGLEYCSERCDFNICIDADLQHDISKIPQFIEAYNRGSDIVLGIKQERTNDSFFKKFSAQTYYQFLKLMGVNIYYNHADFRLLSNKSTIELLKFEEANLFLRGIIPMLGFKTEFIHYTVKERVAGDSKYSMRKMLSLAWRGITSTTIAPLRFFSVLGGGIFLFSVMQGLYVFYKYFKGDVIPGWASTVIPIYFIGGIQLISLGVIGEYIGKIYLETKKRPKYIISNQI